MVLFGICMFDGATEGGENLWREILNVILQGLSFHEIIFPFFLRGTAVFWEILIGFKVNWW